MKFVFTMCTRVAQRGVAPEWANNVGARHRSSVLATRWGGEWHGDRRARRQDEHDQLAARATTRPLYSLTFDGFLIPSKINLASNNRGDTS
jgi:hypothetical protein